MNDPQLAAKMLEQTFNRILHEQMVGIPILNDVLKVQALGFQEFKGRIIGILITPWLMNLVMLPREDDDWSALELGKKQPHRFPSKTFKFMVNEFDGIGKCQTYSLFSPMNEFINQDHALAAAQSFLDTLMVETAPTEECIVDEVQADCIMRGEDTLAVNLDDFAVIEATETAVPVREASEIKLRVAKKLSRRDLLRGSFLRGA